MNRSIFSLTIITLILNCIASSTLRRVPQNYTTIQSAISASVNGDTVLVSDGTYKENINFLGKNIVVTSYFAIDGDLNHIRSTIIDGSTPRHPDTASCVLIVSHEGSDAILQGFTITKGRGTRWTDEHGAGVYVEGGGILITLASPTIQYNIIVNNEATNATLTSSAGGGGIRCGDASATIVNNVIMYNRGMYGGGIVLNYSSGMTIKNNVICLNSVNEFTPGKPTYGGGGIWIYQTIPGNSAPHIIENNTIVGNWAYGTDGGQASGRGGGILHYGGANAVLRNNIIWGNNQFNGAQIYFGGGTLTASYNNIQDGYTGTGNITLAPQFADSSYLLSNSSPCKDAGDPSTMYNDPENPSSAGMALFPSLGTVRNDIGAYGGPGRKQLPKFLRAAIFLPKTEFNFGYILPNASVTVSIPIWNFGSFTLEIDSIGYHTNQGNSLSSKATLPFIIKSGLIDSVKLVWNPTQSFLLNDTAILYHNSQLFQNPVKIVLKGNSIPTPVLEINTADVNFGTIDVNTQSKDTTFSIRNIGTAFDSVFISVDARGIQPPSAFNVSPIAVKLAPGDSQVVTFTLFPRTIVRKFPDQYVPYVYIDSHFGEGAPRYQKKFIIRLTGTISVKDEENTAHNFELKQNFPNPFNPATIISYNLSDKSLVQMKIFNALGQEIVTLVNEEQSLGKHTTKWNASNIPSGVYIYRLQTGGLVAVRKMILAR